MTVQLKKKIIYQFQGNDSSHICDVYYYQLGRKTKAFGGGFLSNLMCTQDVDGTFRSSVGYLERFVRKEHEFWFDEIQNEKQWEFIKDQFVKHNLPKLDGGYKIIWRSPDPRITNLFE